jgi:anti-sigma regulatory factor (Ser/Thr protein kinase)
MSGPLGTPELPSVTVSLPPDESAPGQARHAARRALTVWHLPALVDGIVLAVSELVTNAVRYGRPPLWFELSLRPTGVRLSVHDGDPREPARLDGKEPPASAESGRGLRIVNALATDVGCEQVPGDGKVVHASFSLEPPTR